MRSSRLLSFLLLFTLVGCNGLPFSLGDKLKGNTPVPGSVLTPIATSMEGEGTSVPAATGATPTATQEAGNRLVRIWLPPEFDPDENQLANRLLKARLNEFEAVNPGVQLEVRVKALEGPGGMIDALVAANAAAPSALPDLVLLPRPLLESAALKGLLYPYDGLTKILDDQNWFEYARQLAHLKSSIYGIPFAGDIMVLVHSLALEETAPLNIEATLARGEELLYPAADPQAMFILCMYLAEGGRLQDEQGRPLLEEEPLATILDFVQRASLAEVIPYTMTEYTEDNQVWEAMLSGQYPMAVTWSSTYLADERAEQSNLQMAPLPTPDGAPFTLATGWSWALAGQNPVRRSLSVKLAEFLVEKDFMAEWTQAAGYLPPRVDSLQKWPTTKSRQVMEQVSFSAWLEPPADLLSTIGPAVEQAVMDVIISQMDARSAAQAAIDQINQP